MCLCAPGGSHRSNRAWRRGTVTKTAVLLEAVNVLQTAGQLSKCRTILRSVEIIDKRIKL